MSLGKEYDAHCAFIAGIYYARKGRYEEALELFDECIRNNYTYMEAYIEKGLIYFDRRNYKDALKIFEFASNVNNLYADAYYWMGRSYEMMDIRDSASLRYKQALSLDNTSVEAKKGLQRVSGK
jgi:tetratricopeptide (TPR) repeat protein